MSATFEPFFAKSRTAARPAPADAPVTTTTLGNAMTAPEKILARTDLFGLEGRAERTDVTRAKKPFIAAPI
jgi:hypothetical protein